MKGLLFISLASLIAMAVAAEKYSGKYDDMDVDRILQNNRVLTNYIRCLMDEGPCTAEGRELRSKYAITAHSLIVRQFDLLLSSFSL